MAIKIISGGVKNSTQPQDYSQEPQESQPQNEERTSWGQTLGEFPLRTASRIDELLEGGIGSIGQVGLGLANKGIAALTGKENVLPSRLEIPWAALLRLPVPGKLIPSTIEEVKERNKGIIEPYTRKGALDPQNFPEKVIDRIATDLPILALSGGLSAIPLLGSAVSSLGGQVAEELGSGPLGQAVSSVFSRSLFDFFKKGGGSKSLKTFAENTQKENYAKVDKIAPTLNELAPQLKNSIEELITEVEKKLPSAEKKIVSKKLIQIHNDFNKDTLNVKKAWDRKKELNQFLQEKNPTSFERTYAERARNSLNQFLSEVSEKKPEFGVPYTIGEDITKGIKSQSALREIVEESLDLKKLFSKNPLLKGLVLGGGYKLAGVPGSLLATGAGVASREVLRTFDLARNSKTVREHLKKLSEEALSGNKKSVGNILRQLSEELKEEKIPELKEESSHKSGIKIIRGSLK